MFGFSVKSYVRNAINLSCAKILLTSVIGPIFLILEDGTNRFSRNVGKELPLLPMQ